MKTKPALPVERAARQLTLHLARSNVPDNPAFIGQEFYVASSTASVCDSDKRSVCDEDAVFICSGAQVYAALTKAYNAGARAARKEALADPGRAFAEACEAACKPPRRIRDIVKAKGSW